MGKIEAAYETVFELVGHLAAAGLHGPEETAAALEVVDKAIRDYGHAVLEEALCECAAHRLFGGDSRAAAVRAVIEKGGA